MLNECIPPLAEGIALASSAILAATSQYMTETAMLIDVRENGPVVIWL